MRVGGTQADGPEGDATMWEMVIEEDFDTLDTRLWKTMSGRPGCCPDAYWDASRVKVHDGELELRSSPDASGRWLSGGVAAWATGQAGDNGTAEQLYGRYDVRLKFDKGYGVSTAALLWPAGNVSWPPELDFYEIFSEWGNRDKMMMTTHSLERVSGSTSLAHKMVQTTADGDFSQWHTASVRWMPGRLEYWLDGRLAKVETNAAKIPNIKMWLGLQTHAHKDANGRWPAMPAGKSSISLHVDWVKIWAYLGWPWERWGQTDSAGAR